MPDPLRWLASRDLLVHKGIAWIEDASSLEDVPVRRQVLAVVAKICQYAIDTAYAVRRRHPDVAGLAGITESFCESKVKLDFCVSSMLGDGSLAGIGERIQVLRHATRDGARAIRLDILANALAFVETISVQGNAHDPDELWAAIGGQPRGLDLLDAISDVGALLMGIGRLASDTAWQVASFVLDAAFIIEHPMDTLGDDDRAEFQQQTGRMYELQRAASCHAHGITVDEYVVLHAAMVRKRVGGPPPHLALFLRNVRSARRYMMTNRFVRHPAVQEWPTEPPRVSLESALDRALPAGVQAIAIGGGWDCMGMGRLATVGGQSSGSETWQTIVNGLIERSQFVLMVPSDSVGVRWEVERLRSMGMLAHTVWVMPPADAFPSGEREWDRGRTSLAELGLYLPPFQSEGAFVFLDASGSVRSQHSFDTLWHGGLTELITQHAWRAPAG